MNFLKMTACYLAVWTMSVTPLAQAEAKKQEQKEIIATYIKQMGLNKNQTVAEYWKKVRHVQTDATRRRMDTWVSLNREQLMPKLEYSTSYKDGDGREQTRITISRDGETHTMTIIGGAEPKFKIDNVSFTPKELFDFDKANAKLEKENPSIAKAMKNAKRVSILRKDPVMGVEDFSHLTRRQQAEFLYRARLTLEAGQKVVESAYGQQAINDLNNKYQWVAQFVLGQNVDAAGDLTGKTCVVAGYISVYGGKSQSCGGVGEGADNLKQQIGSFGQSCSSGAVPCNPLVYGFNSSGGAYCIPPGQGHGQVKYATEACNTASPLDKNKASDKVRIIESYMKALGKDVKLHPNEEGKIPPSEREQISAYLGDLNKLIEDAKGLCLQDEGFQAIQKKRTDQKSACDALLIRAFDLQTFIARPEPPVELPPPMQKPDDCGYKPGSRLAANGKDCRCPAGTEEQAMGAGGDGEAQLGCMPIEVRETVRQPRVREKQECDNTSSWLIPLLLLGAIGVGAYFLFRNNGPNCPSPSYASGNSCIYPPTYTPPAGPPTSVCTSPAVLIGGVCQIPTVNPPPVVVPPPTVTTEGGTGTSGTTTGGVR